MAQETSGHMISAKAEPDNPSEDLARVAMLMDFYGSLLTARQAEVLDLHFNSDLSLTEIAEDLRVSRQAVHDAIRTGRDRLEGFESKLGLVLRFRKQKEMARNAMALLGSAIDEKETAVRQESIEQAIVSLKLMLEQL